MARARNARLAEMNAKATVGDSAADRDRCALGALAAAAAFVRDGLVRAGIDPARARALRPISEPDAPAADGASGEADEFVFDDADSLAGSFAEKIGELVRRYEDGREPDFANASLSELLAWCLARAQDAV